MRRRLLPAIFLAAFSGLVAGAGASPVRSPAEVSEKVSPVPESERLLYRVIVGLTPNGIRQMMLPDTSSWDAGKADPELDSLREQFYWFYFELLHGQVFRHAPPQTRFFVAVPAAGSVPRGHGGEEKMFRNYLERRVGWPKSQVAERVRFFQVPIAVPFVKDAAQGLGYDSRGRLVYALGLDCPFFERAFGLETIVLGEEGLLHPDLANKELFHLDMVVAVFRGTAGVVAFVPTYEAAPVDALSHTQLPREMVSRLEAEYGRVVAQLRARGYRVARLPFADHPARSPVNVGKFTDPISRRQFVLLGRYPYHLNLSDGTNPEMQLQLKFQDLGEILAAWRRSRTVSHWKAVEAILRDLWAEMDRAVETPNPIFERQRHIYESNGVAVWPIPIYPTGEGGIHCLVLE